MDFVNINSRANFIRKISELTVDQLAEVDTSLSLVKKQKESDSYYQSLEVSLAPDVKEWLKKYIVKTLNALKQKDVDGDSRFLVGDYNHEINKQDHIAMYDVNFSETLKGKKEKLITSLRVPDSMYEEKNTNFQMVKLSYQEDHAYFCFYRGTKKNSSRRKAVFKNSNRFEFVEHTIVEVGGSFDFIVWGEYIFILNITNFEHAFDYRDHVNTLRDKNLEEIISMPFFDGEESNKDIFLKTSRTYIYSRGLAQIKPETLEVLQANFKARCVELSEIKKRAPTDPIKKEQYIKELGSLWELFDYIDVDGYKIKFNEGDSPKALIHFFSDKIVKSFLTEAIKVAIAYE